MFHERMFYDGSVHIETADLMLILHYYMRYYRTVDKNGTITSMLMFEFIIQNNF